MELQLSNSDCQFFTFTRMLTFMCFHVTYYHLSLQLELPAFLAGQVWWWWTPSAFVCLGKPIFHLCIWRITLLDKLFLVCNFLSFNTLTMSFYTLLACKVSAEKSANRLMGFLCGLLYFFLISFKILYLSLIFAIFDILCPVECLFALR